MTIIQKARQNRIVALTVKSALQKRAALIAPAAPVFRSIRAANLNAAPAKAPCLTVAA